LRIDTLKIGKTKKGGENQHHTQALKTPLKKCQLFKNKKKKKTPKKEDNNTSYYYYYYYLVQ